MEEQKRLSKGIWIPIEIWKDKNLTWNEKILFLEIDSYTSNDKDCFFSNEYISKLLGISETNANKTLSSLIKKGYVVKTRFDGRHRYVKTALSYSTTLPCQKEQPSRAHDNNIYNNNTNKTNNKEKDSKEKEKLQEFVDKIYGMYPSKCTVRNVSTGKCRKDKERIIKLMNNYSMEEIEMVVKHEVDSKLGKHPLKNFSTFLNNFPDPKEISETLYYPKSIEDVKDDDIKPTFTLFLDWLDDAAKKILETNRKGFPVNEKQYQRLIDVAIGGKRTLAYVTLVLNRDGYGVYADERGFMWTYLNYIKANGLYKG